MSLTGTKRPRVYSAFIRGNIRNTPRLPRNGNSMSRKVNFPACFTSSHCLLSVTWAALHRKRNLDWGASKAMYSTAPAVQV